MPSCHRQQRGTWILHFEGSQQIWKKAEAPAKPTPVLATAGQSHRGSSSAVYATDHQGFGSLPVCREHNSGRHHDRVLRETPPQQMETSSSTEAFTRKRPLHLEAHTTSLLDCKWFSSDLLDDMDEQRSFVKRTQSLVSKSSEALTFGSSKQSASDTSSTEGSVGDIRNETFNLSFAAQTESELIPGHERVSKRRVLGEDSNDLALTITDVHPKLSPTKAGNALDEERHDIREESNACELPDPSTSMSPDEFLLILAKAQLGIDFEVKPAHSLYSFFSEVTEEQMASYTTEIVACVRNNDLELLKKLHAEGQALDCFNRFGESLLNMACRRGFESIAQYLMESETVDVRICDDGGRTPLHDACWNPTPQLKICKSIIERDPSLLLVSDRRGCTAFQYARKEHWPQWRKFLFDNRESLTKLKDRDVVSKFAKC